MLTNLRTQSRERGFNIRISRKISFEGIKIFNINISRKGIKKTAEIIKATRKFKKASKNGQICIKIIIMIIIITTKYKYF